ncbi:uncharacterized protein BDV17DRAFT_291300 [Aspergillus undulatus]|uniref:uncharacterized protein n=1 Tax=Aspergillus undulatus TaxID=1810928 RepID=UPI003CCCCD97
MKLPPIDVLLTWPTPNYHDPVHRGNAVLIASIIFMIISTIITALRVWTRLRITCTAGLDDILIVLALGFTIGMAVIVCIATEQWGWTRHIWDVPLEWIPMVSKLNLTFQILFSLACSLTKISLLWFCKRLLIVGKKGIYSVYNIAMLVGIAVVVISSALFILFSIFQCRPIHAYWDLEPQYPHTCLNDGAIVFSASTINIFTDVLTTILPMPLIWKLKMPTRQRLAVMAIFGLGIVVDVAGAIRTVYVWKSMIASYDTTWEGWPILLAATVEINLGLICASAPALRPLVNFCLPRILDTAAYPYDSNRQNNFKGSKESKHSWKLRSLTGQSKEARDSRHFSLNAKVPHEHMKVIRTVEMETHSETRSLNHTIGNDYTISSPRAQSPVATDEVHLIHDDSVRSVSPSTTIIRTETRDVPPRRARESD